MAVTVTSVQVIPLNPSIRHPSTGTSFISTTYIYDKRQYRPEDGPTSKVRYG
jgi:hypothetical protein